MQSDRRNDLAAATSFRAIHGTGQTAPDDRSLFHVPVPLHFLGWHVHQYRHFWIWLGRLESQRLVDELQAVPLTMPIYITGLARSGSTLLHEIVASHDGVATQRVKDYPMVFTPYWWRQATARLKPTPPRPRVHQDRIEIRSESPDALEDMLWMAFFPGCHDPARDNRLTARTAHRDFERFYSSHIRKLLLAEKAMRYAAKANYHVGRLAYLGRLLPDARFVIPVRAPCTHIASLVRQHRRFTCGQRNNSRALAYMQRSGHFEFGRDRRPMNLGDGQRVRSILRAWSRGAEVFGWALYWDMVYDYLSQFLTSQPELRKRVRIVPYEELCASPEKTIRALLEHCELPEVDKVLARFAPTIRLPDYYEDPLSAADQSLIADVTGATARKWGY
jgi:hypothetical protein